MSTLVEIESAATALPLDEQRLLLAHLAASVGNAISAGGVSDSPRSTSRRGFPISKGRIAFTSEDVVRLEAEINGAT